MSWKLRELHLNSNIQIEIVLCIKLNFVVWCSSKDLMKIIYSLKLKRLLINNKRKFRIKKYLEASKFEVQQCLESWENFTSSAGTDWSNLENSVDGLPFFSLSSIIRSCLCLVLFGTSVKLARILRTSRSSLLMAISIGVSCWSNVTPAGSTLPNMRLFMVSFSPFYIKKKRCCFCDLCLTRIPKLLEHKIFCPRRPRPGEESRSTWLWSNSPIVRELLFWAEQANLFWC